MIEVTATTEGVRIEGVNKSFGAQTVIEGIDVAIEPGEFVVIVGPSGCGKSTLLRMIAGLETVSAGRILIGGRDVTHVEPSRRDVAMVFQSYALYPYLDVAGNIGFGLSVARRPKAEIRKQVGEVAEMLRLNDLLHRRPADLSGGQRQRVAIGRALVRKPAVFLFDEPLSNLDAELRVELRRELARLHQQIGATMIYVTHDQVEAMTLADRIVVMRGGVVQQVGRPLELYRAPANTFVAGFIGSPRMNFLQMVVRGSDGHVHHISRTSHGAGDVRIVLDRTLPAGTLVTAGIRPESLGPDAVTGGLQLSAVSTMVEAMGNLTYEYAEGEGDLRLTIEHRGAIEARPGQRLDLWCASDQIHLFDVDGTRIGTWQD